ncbi:MAG TPA: type ISP restriction/modification enzyme, partial [Thermoanaerobaculia bacterium]|nr:type ISP restriction/modification enzyme [Thermoanaerobaculia bacterium]
MRARSVFDLVRERLSRPGEPPSLLLTRQPTAAESEDASFLQDVPWLRESKIDRGGRQLCEDLHRYGLGIVLCASEGEAERRLRQVGPTLAAEILPCPRAVAGESLSPSSRRRHGVYATPPPLVGYLVRSIHRLLQEKLGWAAGLADPRVRLLDPAAGTMNFVRAAWRLALEAHWHRGREAGELLGEHLLPHSLGIELLPEIHARGLASLSRFLRVYGLDGPASLPAILGDALAPAKEILDFPANVVLGNPPWRGRSDSRGDWITDLLAAYSEVDGRPLGERNPKWLQDDAVKFLRLAQWKIDQAGEGIAGLVLPHNGLDALTLKGLRRSLLGSFDEIHVLDLHGNRRKREKSPGGGLDENVFEGVAQGAALFLLVKRPGLPKRVRLADLYGERRAKLAALTASHVGTTAWSEIEPGPPFYLFATNDRRLEREYRRGLSLPEIFPLHSAGVITGCDALAVSVERRLLEERLDAQREASAPDRRLHPDRWEELRRDPEWPSHIRTFLARPFDHRFLFYADYFLERPRGAVMAHMLWGDNLALVACRQGRDDLAALVTRSLAGHKAVSGYDVSTLFPLYRDPGVPNLAPDLLARLAERYGAPPSPEEVLGYVYAVLYDPGYRTRYGKLLRTDFPRIPFPEEQKLFLRRAALGRELIGLHLLTDERLLRPAVRLAGAAPGDSIKNRLGSGARTLLDYHPAQVRLHVNTFGLRFEGLVPEVFRYEIGGHAVLPGWLRARAGRVLTAEAAATFCRIAAALTLTLEVQGK